MKISKNRQTAIDIINLFEGLLDYYGIDIPNPDADENENRAHIYGSDYYELEDGITELLGGDEQ